MFGDTDIALIAETLILKEALFGERQTMSFRNLLHDLIYCLFNVGRRNLCS